MYPVTIMRAEDAETIGACISSYVISITTVYLYYLS